MKEPTRRAALSAAALAGSALSAPIVAAQGEAKKEPPNPQPKDRDFVIAAGMTEQEADCWEQIAKAAGMFFELPKLHPSDAQEVAQAIHIVQNKLLARPTYRRYLELAKKARGGAT